MDTYSEYNQIIIAKEDETKTIFIIDQSTCYNLVIYIFKSQTSQNGGLYQWYTC